MFDIDIAAVDLDDVKVVSPHVQLIASTAYYPPVDVDNHRSTLQLQPLDDATASESVIEFAGRGCYRSWNRPNPATATINGYLSNIIAQKHLSVLRHASATFYVTGVSRSFTHEIVTHAHLARSQESQRFVPAEDVNFVIPPLLREVAKDHEDFAEIVERMRSVVGATRDMYAQLVELLKTYGFKGKQAREAARAFLVNSVETRLTITANYQAWLEFLVKRHNPHADAEMQEVAGMIYEHLIGLAPNIFGPDVREIWDESFAERRREETL